MRKSGGKGGGRKGRKDEKEGRVYVEGNQLPVMNYAEERVSEGGTSKGERGKEEGSRVCVLKVERM